MVAQKNHLRHKLFLGLSALHISPNSPWLLLGDFNYVLALDETTSVCLNTAAKCDIFRPWVGLHGLVDLGSARSKYTCWQERSMENIHVARLDRGLCMVSLISACWYQTFGKSFIKPLPSSA